MLNSYYLKQNLNVAQLTAAQVLEKLHTLFGCVYLGNNHLPFIGLLPQQYCINSKGKFEVYSRVNCASYTLIDSVLSFEDFVEFNGPDQMNDSEGFNGGYIGFFDYNYLANQQINSNVKSQPNAYLGHYQSYLKLEQGQWYFYSCEAEAEQILAQILSALNFSNPVKFELIAPCTPCWTKKEYQHAFDQVQAYIRAGDCYQINLTQEFSAQANGYLIDSAEQFWNLTDAPYSTYLKINEFEILSCSPELFINFDQNKKIVTRPIKGTMPRFEDPKLDNLSKQKLISSEKDQAENLMIVDLLRNDLSVFAEIGSVQTSKLFNIESFNQVHHMVSEISATLKSDVNALQVLFSALPGGSITGAPKIRAMQIIEELEAAQRGAYCGSMGYFNYDGTGSWNILIRTIQKQEQDISIWAGGGITIASNCDAEYQECFDKVSAMLHLLDSWKKN